MKKIIFLILFFQVSVFSQPYFQKITTGIIATDLSSSTMAAWGDYNNDGYQDLVVVPWNDGCWSCRSPILFYKNNGDGTFNISFTVVTDAALSCNGVAFGDYDNDGRLDLFICRYLNQTNFLCHNDGDLGFSLLSTGNIATDVASSQGCAWSDYDKDGWLDLFVAHGQNQNNALYHNNGDGTFTKITTGAIVNDGGDSRACAWGDYDNDGWPDLFVANYGVQKSFLYHNNGNGTFTKIINQTPVDSAWYCEGCNWVDYDNDGWLDLFMALNANVNKLYHNNHNGTFSLVNLLPNQTLGWSYWSSWADIDNDGWQDLFIPKRNVNGYTSNNYLYKNNNGTSFTRITTDVATQEGGISDAGVFADYNNDGKMDLFVANGSSGSLSNNFFYQNSNPSSGNYITLKLRGCILNKSAIGARVTVVTGNLRQMHEVSGGNGAQNMLWQHFGLGSATVIDTIIVQWTTGVITRIMNVAVNQSLELTDMNCPLEVINNEVPSKFELLQNYPNPFNPITTIKYSLLKNTNVKLTIYDITGKFIRNIFNGFETKGNHQAEFDGSNLASGVYIYKIEAGDFSDIKKMVLMK